jgi:hypothetical protein
MRLRAELKVASSAHFMKRRFHCKKVEQVKGKVIVILSQANESLIGHVDAADLKIRDVSLRST